MAKMPKSLREQERRAEELRQQVYGLDNEGTGEGDDPSQQQPASQDQDTTGTEGEDNPTDQPQNPAPEDNPAPQDDNPGDADESLAERYRKLDAAHKTLQGKYRSEVPRLQEENKNLRERLEKLESQAQQAEERAEESERKLSDHLQRLNDEFGEDLAESFRETAREIASEEVKSDRQKREEEAQNRFMAAVRRNITDFDQINPDPEFIQWLTSQPDPVTGGTLRDKLNQAGAERDLQTVVQIFDEFRRRNQNPSQQPQNTDPTAPENQVTPKSRSTPPNDQPQQPGYTTDDYVQLQRDIARGKYRGREEEARRLEEEIHAAITQ